MISVNICSSIGLSGETLYRLIRHVTPDLYTADRRTSLTLLDLPLDIISEMPLAASFFSATQRTRLIWARFRIMSACCGGSGGHRTLSAAQKRLWPTTNRCCTRDRSEDLPMKCSSMPGSSYIGQLLLRTGPVVKSPNCLSMLADPAS